MKLLRLDIENINSIYGHQWVDFVGQMKEAPLFLICGPTGAGKSTLLDAISLALFGSTPRLHDSGPLASRLDVKPELALSRGTAYGKAELTFRKTNPGEGPRTYRATWEIWRGNKLHPTPTGDFSKPYRRLEEQEETSGQWQLLANEYPNGVNEYRRTLNHVLEGFTLQDFTRCMLLAQGEFAVFLKASETERADILERLTRTETYKKIGGQAATCCTAAKEETRDAERALGNVQLMEPAAVAALMTSLGEHEAQAVAAAGRAETAQGALIWLDEARKLATQENEAQSLLAETDGALQEAAGEFRILEAFLEAVPALDALRVAREARAGVGQRRSRVNQLVGELATLAPKLSLEETALLEAKARVGVARQALTEREPDLKMARARRTLLAAASQEATTAKTSHQKALNERHQAEALFTDATRALQERQAALTEAQAGLEREPWGELATQLGALEARIDGHGNREKELASDREHWERLRKAMAKDTTASALLGAKSQEARSAAGLAKAEAQRRGIALTALLKGAERAAEARTGLDQARSSLEQRQLRLASLGTLLEEASKTGKSLVQALGEQEKAVALAGGAQLTADRLKVAALEAEQQAEATRRNLDLMRWAWGLAQERDRLTEGAPCPLCGAANHPALDDPAQGDKDQQIKDACLRLEGSLATAEPAAAEAGVQRDRAVREADLAASKVGEAGRRVKEGEEENGRRREAAAAAAQAAGLEGREDTREEAAAEVARQLESLGERRKALDAAEAAATKAQDDLTKAVRSADLAEAAWNVAATQSTGKREQAATEEARLGQVQTTLEHERQALEQTLATHDLPSDLQVAQEEANQRVTRYLKAARALEQAGGLLTAAQAKAHQAQLVRDHAVKVSEDRGEEAAQRQEDLRLAQDGVAQVLGGQDPEPLEQRLNQAITAAETACRDLDRAVQVERDRRLQMETSLGFERGELEVAQGLLEQAEATLSPLRAPYGTEADLEALDLPPTRAQALQARKEGLTSLRTTRSALREVAQTQRQSHLDRRPPGPGTELPEADLKAEVSAAMDDQRQHNEEAGAAKNRLKTQEEAALAHAQAQERVRAARAQEALWSRLNALIGTRNGEAFQKFAQGLNLRELLDKANLRMQKLRPRFRLVPAKDQDNADRLAFAIEDRDHASEVGPVNGLSGGEAFLVSLCLALALADYRTVRMPIETLLLDEGFGTLDRATLGDVMGILGSLTSSSTQVGIISHVEALQESDLPKIRVRPEGLGRSRIVVEAS